MGYSPWGHKESDTTERQSDEAHNGIERARVLKLHGSRLESPLHQSLIM